MSDASIYDAVIVGSGPNGLAAAITLAEAGRSVLLLEAQARIGGGLRSEVLTSAGVVHDLCSAVHPLGMASPFFRRLKLERYGLEWLHPEIPAAHPLDDGGAVLLHRSLDETAEGLAADGPAYTRLFHVMLRHWEAVLREVLAPPFHVPRHPLLLGRFGLKALRSAGGLATSLFSGERARALFGGLAAHSMVPLDGRASAASGLLLGLLAHAVGWPLPRGGAMSLAEAMGKYLEALGGEIQTGVTVRSIDDLPSAKTVLLDVTARQFVAMADAHLVGRYRRRLERFRYGPAVFKLDAVLSGPIPWKASACRRAGTLHLGGSLAEMVECERDVNQGRQPKRPYVLLAQPSRVDPTRAPQGREVLWAYCHLPHGSPVNMTEPILDQIERFAPGFRDLIVDLVATAPAALEQRNANLVGGSISGGSMDLPQIVRRPILGPRPYRTPLDGVYLCSSSTPPGPGVHGMCGYLAAKRAMADAERDSR